MPAVEVVRLTGKEVKNVLATVDGAPIPTITVSQLRAVNPCRFDGRVAGRRVLRASVRAKGLSA
jgi:formamidopyrimidine-DNA glycosylase